MSDVTALQPTGFLDSRWLNFKLGAAHREETARTMVQEICYPDERILRSTGKLLRLWRKRLRSLCFPGSLVSPITALFAGNCPPSCVSNTPASRLCCQSWLCPFCYGRELEHMFDALQVLQHRYTTRLNLFACRWADTYAPQQGPVTVTWLSSLLEEKLRWRAERARRLHALGGFQKIVVVPCPVQDGYDLAAVQIIRSGVFAFNGLATLPMRDANEEYEVIKRRYCYEERAALVKYFAYPVALLTENAPLMSVIFQARAGKRLSATYGALRFRRTGGRDGGPARGG